jgi:hypothetical protein
MKFIGSICLILTVASLIAEYVGCYSLGWIGIFWGLSDPLLNFAFQFLLFLILLIMWLVSLFKKRSRTWTSLGMALFVGILLVDWYLLPRPVNLIVHGIRNHVMKVCTLDDLRRFSRSVHRDLPNIDIFHGDTSSLSAVQLITYQNLQNTYPFLNWGLGSRPDPLVSDHDGAVTVEWGGAMSGHWGFSISVDGSKNDPGTIDDSGIIRMSDDIYFFDGE